MYNVNLFANKVKKHTAWKNAPRGERLGNWAEAMADRHWEAVGILEMYLSFSGSTRP